ncbi:CLUMA_CG010231, isoform A [Clunio marinus]|uniref:CLUMA_CG010231, isoform A n=1 Tax=Clunio marinus TaxID=568069 RepID=A0A1J1I872_9DIPT|nr:CLUMA_CG010231, isoform A [Clunio marinus]
MKNSQQDEEVRRYFQVLLKLITFENMISFFLLLFWQQHLDDEINYFDSKFRITIFKKPKLSESCHQKSYLIIYIRLYEALHSIQH